MLAAALFSHTDKSIGFSSWLAVYVHKDISWEQDLEAASI